MAIKIVSKAKKGVAKLVKSKAIVSPLTIKMDFLRAYKTMAGHVGLACEAVNIARCTYMTWLRNDVEFAQSMDSARQAMLDSAEQCLNIAIASGDTDAAKFVLKNLAKDRGYTDKIQIEATVTMGAADIIKQAHATLIKEGTNK